ncbi:MAG: hypothetical protein H7263_14570 [Candidatus Sericytochromatia bacterium]|nr:hypothetical protein [Candidatus Sericytochromatia bacterium]
MVIDGVKITGKSTKFVGKATVGFVGKVGNGVGNKTKLAGANLQKLGDSAHKFGNQMDKKAVQLKNSKHLLAKTFGYAGAVGLAKASHFIGNKTKHLGRQINTLGNDIKTNTGKFVSSAKIESKKLISSVHTTGHNIKNQARRLTTAIDTATTEFVHSAQKNANTITNFVGSTTGNIVHGTKQNIHNIKQGVGSFVGNVNQGMTNTWNSIWGH